MVASPAWEDSEIREKKERSAIRVERGHIGDTPRGMAFPPHVGSEVSVLSFLSHPPIPGLCRLDRGSCLVLRCDSPEAWRRREASLALGKGTRPRR